MNKKHGFLQSLFSIFTGLNLVIQSLFPALALAAIANPARAEDATNSAEQTQTTVTADISNSTGPTGASGAVGDTSASGPTGASGETGASGPTGSSGPSAEMTGEILDGISTESATITETPVSTESAEGATTTSSDQPSDTSNQSEPSGQITGTPAPTVTTMPTSTGAVQEINNGHVNAAIVKNTKADTLNLDPVNAIPSATLTTDKADYAPTDTVIVIGTDFLPNQTYRLFISSKDPPPVNFETDVTTNDKGSFIYAYQLDSRYRPNYSVEIKDISGNIIASTTFTDSNPAANLEQCHNGGSGDSFVDCKDPSSSANTWGSGNAGSGSARLFEGNSQNYRLILTDMPVGTAQTIKIGQQFTKGGKMAYDFPTGPGNLGTATTPIGLAGIFPCDDNHGGLYVTPCDHQVPSLTSAGKLAIGSIPAGTIPDATVDAETRSTQTAYYATSESTPPTRSPNSMYVYGATPGSFGGYSFNGTASDVSGGDSELDWSFTITPTSSTVVIAWGAHISKSGDYGTKGTAVSITGSPYHTFLRDATWGNVGNQDMQMSAGAIIPPSTITVHKTTSPAGGTGFGFTTTGLTPSTFNLNDTGSETFLSVVPGSYSITEDSPSSPYTLTGLSCTATGTGTSARTDTVTRSATVTIGAGGGGTVDCVFTNTIQNGTLTVNKVLVPSADPGRFNLRIDGTTAGTGANVGNGGTTGSVSVAPGSHTVSEIAGSITDLTNYTSVISGDCDAQGVVSVPVGTSKSCTITNTRIPRLTVIKVVTNDNGGTKQVSDFPLFVDGHSVTSGATNTFSVGGHVVSETGDANYTATFSGDCDSQGNVTLAGGDNKTCTLTNNDKAAHLIVIKHVVKDNGGTATAGNFTMTINTVTALGGNSFAGSESPGTNKTLTTVGSFSVTEAGPDGYSATYSSDCSGTIALGETKTCTVTNDDQPATLVVKKIVRNNYGGTLGASDFNFSVNGETAIAFHPGGENDLTVNAGTYSVTETPPSGYTASYDNCSGLIIANGGSATCTITNSDKPALLTLVKTVTKDNGGTALATDWTLSASGPTTISGTSGSANVTHANISAGTYTLAESGGPSGYSEGSWSCVKNTNAPVAGASITLSNGDSATCTINNDDIAPTITLIKHVDNNHGGTAGANDFGLTVGGNSVASGATTGVMANTDIAINETGKPGYRFVSITGTGCPTVLGSTVNLKPGGTITCTITNEDIEPKLTVTKVVTNNNGGTKVVSDFPLFVDQTSVISGVANGFDAGTYKVSETGDPGYTAQIDGDCDSEGNVTLAVGDVKSCTITNDDKPATLTLVKTVINDNGGTKRIPDFVLKIDGSAVTSGTPVTVNAGLHTATEVNLAGYTPSGWGQDCATNGTIALLPGENKTCTIINDDIAPSLHLRKTIVNDNGGAAEATDWTLSAEGPTPLNGSTPVDSGATFKAGTYTLSETGGPDGYSAGVWSCDGGSLIRNQVTLELGESATCTITNNDNVPSLTLIKHVTNDNGGTAVATDWNLTATGPTTITGSGGATSNTSFKAGTYTLSESSGAPGYSASDWSCRGGIQNGSSVTVGLGESVTCEITNNDNKPSLTLVKEVVNDNGGAAVAADWTLSASGPTPISGVGGAKSGDSFKTGTYTLSESDTVGGYSASAWGCTGGTQNENTVSIGLGESAVCTIINDDIGPKLTVTKVVVNHGGSNGAISDFPLFVDTTSVTSGEENGFNVGKHIVSETNQAGYSSVISGACDPRTGEVTLGPGDVKACTITNTRDTGTIIVNKEVDTNSDGQYEGGNSEANRLGFAWSLDSGSANRPMGTSETDVTTVDTHTINEKPVDGYVFTGWFSPSDEIYSCREPELTTLPISLTVGFGQTKEITLCNQLQNPILTITKQNDTGGADKHPGESVKFTLTVEATQSAINNVVVYDLPPGGFKYHTGSWTANTTNTSRGTLGDLKAGGVTTEPTYASPGAWNLGDMAKDEKVTLTYIADIDGSINPGLYKDLAWAIGTSLASEKVLALASNPGYFAQNYVGTTVNIVKDTTNGSSINVIQTHEGQVLGASTELPATGANAFWLILAVALISLGTGLFTYGIKLNTQKIHKKTNRKRRYHA